MNMIPGPYEFNEDDDTIMGEGGICIATVYMPEDFPCFDAEDGDDSLEKATSQCKATGRVLGASFDLLEACKAALASAHPNPKEHPTMYAAWKQLEAAIAKAQGE